MLSERRGPVRSARVVALLHTAYPSFCSLHFDYAAHSAMRLLIKPRYAARMANTVVQATVSHAIDQPTSRARLIETRTTKRSRARTCISTARAMAIDGR